MSARPSANLMPLRSRNVYVFRCRSAWEAPRKVGHEAVPLSAADALEADEPVVQHWRGAAPPRRCSRQRGIDGVGVAESDSEGAAAVGGAARPARRSTASRRRGPRPPAARRASSPRARRRLDRRGRAYRRPRRSPRRRPGATATPFGAAPTGKVPVSIARAGSMRDTVPSRLFVTQTRRCRRRRRSGPLPTRIDLVTAPERGSIRTSVVAAGSVTHTAPPPTAIQRAAAPTSIVVHGRARWRGRSSRSLRSSAFVTQTAPAPKATPVGVFPTRIGRRPLPVAGSMRETVPSSEFATHTAPPPTAIPTGPLPTSIVSTTSWLSGSSRTTLPSPFELVTQIEPSPAATRCGEAIPGASSTIARDLASTTPTALSCTRRERHVSAGAPPSAKTGIATAAASTPASAPMTTGRR